MEALEKRLEYHELLMTLENLKDIKSYPLPKGFEFVFWASDDDLKSWINIHIASGEFMSKKEAEKVFHQFYDEFYNEFNNRCFFIVDINTKKKVATATVSPANEHRYSCVIDWLAIDKQYWGHKLSRPLIAKTLETAKNLGYDKILLHTQTHSWLAAVLYLDIGFEPLIYEDDIKGWQILKTITNHEKLKNLPPIDEQDMYFEDAVNIVNELNKQHNLYTYQIWHKDGKNEVWVRENNLIYKYLYFDKGLKLQCEIFALNEEN